MGNFHMTTEYSRQAVSSLGGTDKLFDVTVQALVVDVEFFKEASVLN